MFRLPELPYDYDALEPVVSAETMRFHHDRHHGKYVENTNKLLLEADEAPSDLESVVRRADQTPQLDKLFENAAQAWNHTFFWICMSPTKSSLQGALASAVERCFGNPTKLKRDFVDEGVSHFGSGWVWLAAQARTLKVFSTHDAEDSLTHMGMVPLLVCDLWEHAYYLDHHNDRAGYLSAWFDTLPNWDFAADQYRAAQGMKSAWRHPLPNENLTKRAPITAPDFDRARPGPKDGAWDAINSRRTRG